MQNVKMYNFAVQLQLYCKKRWTDFISFQICNNFHVTNASIGYAT